MDLFFCSQNSLQQLEIIVLLLLCGKAENKTCIATNIFRDDICMSFLQPEDS